MGGRGRGQSRGDVDRKFAILKFTFVSFGEDRGGSGGGGGHGGFCGGQGGGVRGGRGDRGGGRAGGQSGGGGLTFYDQKVDFFGLADRRIYWYSSLDIGTNNLPTCMPSSTFLGPFGGDFAPEQHKMLFSGCFRLFLLQEWAY